MLFLSRIANFEPSSVKRNFDRSVWRHCITCTISHLSGDICVKYLMWWNIILQNIKSSSKFYNKLHTWSTNACTFHQNRQRHKTPSENIHYWPSPMTFILWISECLPIITLQLFTNPKVSIIKRCKDILSIIKCNQKVKGKLTFDL